MHTIIKFALPIFAAIFMFLIMASAVAKFG